MTPSDPEGTVPGTTIVKALGTARRTAAFIPLEAGLLGKAAKGMRRADCTA
jgi:hypothetical protein